MKQSTKTSFEFVSFQTHEFRCHSQFYFLFHKIENNSKLLYFTIRGGSLKKMAKKIIPNVPTNKKV